MIDNVISMILYGIHSSDSQNKFIIFTNPIIKYWCLNFGNTTTTVNERIDTANIKYDPLTSRG